MSRVEQARRAAGMTQNAAAAILGVSYPTYLKKEQNPSLFTFGELEMLGREMDDLSRDILGGVFDEVEAEAFDDRSIAELTLGEYFSGRNSGDRLYGDFITAKRNFFTARV